MAPRQPEDSEKQVKLFVAEDVNQIVRLRLKRLTLNTLPAVAPTALELSR